MAHRGNRSQVIKYVYIDIDYKKFKKHIIFKWIFTLPMASTPTVNTWEVLSVRSPCLFFFSLIQPLTADFAWLPGYIKAFGFVAAGRNLSADVELSKGGLWIESARNTDSKSGVGSKGEKEWLTTGEILD